MKSGMLSVAIVARSLALAAPASAQGVKIGILNDQSGVYADYGGKYSLEAAHMAVEDFGGSVLGKKIDLVIADLSARSRHDPHRTRGPLQQAEGSGRV